MKPISADKKKIMTVKAAVVLDCSSTRKGGMAG